ncbi:39447_t:CDS:2, partial [Gigaspora margarita]
KKVFSSDAARKNEGITGQASHETTGLENPEEISPVSNRDPEDKQVFNYVGWFNIYNPDQELWDENEVYALVREEAQPMTHLREEPDLMEEGPEHVDVGSDSGDTFDEFTYEEKMLDEIEGYHTEESATEEIADIESPAIYFTAIDEPPNQTKEP